jgi:hypothetical protein
VPVAHAQAGAVVVTFRNEMMTPVIVQGYTIINGMPKKGMALVVRPGKTVSDNNVPPGTVRFYSVMDANRPAIEYVRNLAVPVGRQDINLLIRGVPPKVIVTKAAQ